MADLTGVQVQDMPEASAVNNADYFMIVQNDVNKKANKSLVLDGIATEDETGNLIDLEIDNTTYVLTAKLYNKDGALLSTSTSVDLPLETMVVGASYDSATKEIVLTLKNGTTVRFSVADLISGLQTEITVNNKLASDLVDDTNQVHKFATSAQLTQISTNTTAISGIKNGTSINNFAGVETALNGKQPTIDSSHKLNADLVDDTTATHKFATASQLTQIATNTDNILLRSLITETGNKIQLEINNTTYVLTAKLYDKNNNLISTSTGIDLPLETMVVGASYDSATKEIVLTLKNGTTVRFSVADLVSGLQSEITSSNKLASDLVDDANQTNKFVTASEKSQITTNATNISGIKDGTTIDSFSDVETALGDIDTEQTAQDTAIGNNTTAIANTNTALQNDYNDLLNVISQIVPTETDEDSEMTFTDTLNARFLSIVEKGNTLQNSYTGKNKCINAFFYNANSIHFTVNPHTFEKTFTLSFIPNITVNDLQLFIGSTGLTGNNQNLVAGTRYSITRTLSDEQYAEVQASTQTTIDLSLYKSQAGMDTTSVIGEAQIEFNDAFSSFEPYCGGTASPNPDYPQDVRVVTGNNNVIIRNKNLFDGVLEEGSYDNTTGEKIAVQQHYRNKNIIPIFSNSNCTISINGTAHRYIIYEYDSNKTYLGYKEATGTFTTSNNCRYINFRCYNADFIWDFAYQKIQIELGSTATDYVAHAEQNLPLSLGNIELCKIGDYQDYITGTVDNWKVKRKVRHVSLAIADMNNNEEYPGWTGQTQFINDLNITETTSLNSNYYCNIKPKNTSNCIRIGTQGTSFLPATTYGLTQTQWKTNYPNLVFELYYGITNAQAQDETPITDTTLIEQLNAIYNSRSYANETNITATCEDGNAPMIISATALKQLS